MMTSQSSSSDEQSLSLTVRWLERAVIGLNLCPFAKSVHVKGQIHYRLSHAIQTQELLAVLKEELQALQATDPTVRDTTLLILPDCFPDFLDFNDFLQAADDVLYALELDGTLQIASFHPKFQFAGTSEDDITNYTNRAPFPVLHLIREDSIARAVEAFPEAEMIYEKNMRTLEELGHDGWKALDLEIDGQQEAGGNA
jgi:hypothetical protein